MNQPNLQSLLPPKSPPVSNAHLIAANKKAAELILLSIKLQLDSQDSTYHVKDTRTIIRDDS